MPVLGLTAARFDNEANASLSALYNFYAKQFSVYTGESNPPMPMGDQYYMTYTTTTSTTETSGTMNRISLNPRPDEEDIYIDLGIYEYQNVQIDIDGLENAQVTAQVLTGAPEDHNDFGGTENKVHITPFTAFETAPCGLKATLPACSVTAFTFHA